MQKSFDANAAGTEVPSDETMALINRFTQKELGKDEVFVFSAVLCDNEIDRDFERFSTESLKALAPLFLGKTAIKNHSMNADDQSARTFKTEVICDETRKNSLGEPYTYLKAYCYMPRLPKNEELIAEIGAGIKKEVSVSCAVQKAVCSVCGKDERQEPCQHRRGRIYGDTLCYFSLEEPTDAYEWSFVAVPAQKNAGITKSFSLEKVLEKAVKTEKAEGIYLTKAEAGKLQKEFAALKAKAADGERYLAVLRETFLRESAKAFPTFSEEMRQAICRDLSTEELQTACEAFKEARKTAEIPVPLLAARKNIGEKAVQNTAFKF